MAAKRSIVVMAGIAGLLALIGFSSSSKAAGKPKSKPSNGCDPGPFVADPVNVQEAIEIAVDNGARSDESVAAWAANHLFPSHPDTGAPVFWPPETSGDKFQLCFWGLVVAQVEAFKNANGIPPWPACDDGSAVIDGHCAPEEAPPIDLSHWTNADPRWPLPGTFYQVELGDRFLGTATGSGEAHSIVYTTLLSAAYHAAVTVGEADDDEATEFARSVARNPTMRRDYYYLILCSPWNDAAYGTHGYSQSLVGDLDSPVGRAIRLLPAQYDNRARIRDGLQPVRNVRLGNPSSPGDKSGTAIAKDQRSFEFLWLPAINLEVLWSSGGEIITTEGMTWEDGSTMLMPPPVVAELGIQGVPEGQWGC